MRIEMPFHIVANRYPGLVKQIMSKLQSGKSQHKNANVEDLNWELSWGETIKGGLLRPSDLLNYKPKPKPVLLVQEKIKQRIDRSSVRLVGKIGRWWGQAWIYDGLKQTGVIPPEVVDEITKSELKHEVERQRVANLTPEQRNAEIQANLRELRKSPGFVEVQLRK